jgi:hypothetical protein
LHLVGQEYLGKVMQVETTTKAIAQQVAVAAVLAERVEMPNRQTLEERLGRG